MNEMIIKRAVNKAKKSLCRYKICAIGVNYRGEIIGYSYNRPQYQKKGGGTHAEMHLMQKFYKKGLKKIYLLRTNMSGDLLPIHPCDMCQEKSEELNIKIIPILKKFEE